MNTLIFFNSQKSNAAETAQDAGNLLKSVGFNMVLSSQNPGAGTADDMLLRADIVLAVGGDGTILHTAKRAALFGKPVLGINTGSLGFLAGLERAGLTLLKKLAAGEYKISSRTMLEITCGEKKAVALNDAVVSKQTLGKAAKIRAFANGEKLLDYISDGIIVATPTGSTAYSLSAGGCIVEPCAKCVILNPICAHTTFSRPIVFDDGTLISFKFDSARQEKFTLFADGEFVCDCGGESVVDVCRSETRANFIELENGGFFKALSEKIR
jgi:NAD+ kinase